MFVLMYMSKLNYISIRSSDDPNYATYIEDSTKTWIIYLDENNVPCRYLPDRTIDRDILKENKELLSELARIKGTDEYSGW